MVRNRWSSSSKPHRSEDLRARLQGSPATGKATDAVGVRPPVPRGIVGQTSRGATSVAEVAAKLKTNATVPSMIRRPHEPGRSPPAIPAPCQRPHRDLDSRPSYEGETSELLRRRSVCRGPVHSNWNESAWTGSQPSGPDPSRRPQHERPRIPAAVHQLRRGVVAWLPSSHEAYPEADYFPGSIASSG